MKQDKTPDPADIGFFGADAVMRKTDPLTDLIKQTGLAVHGAYPSMDFGSIFRGATRHGAASSRLVRDYARDSSYLHIPIGMSTFSYIAYATRSIT
jgi:hypothetical protein